jgi:hypothetical protein
MRIESDEYRIEVLSPQAILPAETLSTPSGLESICSASIGRANDKYYHIIRHYPILSSEAGSEEDFFFCVALDSLYESAGKPVYMLAIFAAWPA